MGEAIRLIKKKNRKKHTGVSNWGSKGGLTKHYKSGHSPQHPKVKAARLWEEWRKQEEAVNESEAKKTPMYQSVSDLFHKSK